MRMPLLRLTSSVKQPVLRSVHLRRDSVLPGRRVNCNEHRTMTLLRQRLLVYPLGLFHAYRLQKVAYWESQARWLQRSSMCTIHTSTIRRSYYTGRPSHVTSRQALLNQH